MPLQLRRGTSTDIAGFVPAEGELIYNTETGAISVGNGEVAGGRAVVNITPQEIAQYTANALVDGAHSGITYELVDGVINSVVVPDLSNYAGTIEADAFKGTLVGDDSTILVDGLANKINLNGTVKDNVAPDATGAYDLGTGSARFRDLYTSGSVHIGSAAITNPSAGIVNLPAGSTINGVVIGTGSGGSGITAVLEDTSPQLGGDLDLNNSDIIGTGNININGSITATSVDAGSITATTISASLGTDLGLNSNDITGVGNINIDGSVTATDFYGNLSGTFAGTLSGYLDLGGYGIQGSGQMSFVSDSGTLRGFTGFRGTDTNFPFTMHFRRSKGTTAAPTAVAGNEQISGLISEGYDGTNYTQATGIISRAVGTVSAGVVSGQIEFYTSDFIGTSTRRLTIDHAGLITASANIRIDSNSYSSSAPFSVRQFHGTADSNNITFSRARGTSTSPTTVQNGDDLCDLVFSAYDGSTYIGGGGVSMYVSGAVSTGSVPTNLTLSVNTGSSVVERIVIGSDGVIGFAVTELSALEVNTSAVATYWKVTINGTPYAIPAYALV